MSHIDPNGLGRTRQPAFLSAPVEVRDGLRRRLDDAMAGSTTSRPMDRVG